MSATILFWAVLVSSQSSVAPCLAAPLPIATDDQPSPSPPTILVPFPWAPITAPIRPIPEQPKEAPTEPAPSPPDRWFLMQELQGTWLGNLLDDNRTQLYGWTSFSYTASSDRVSNLPMVFNDRANAFLLQQFWTRLERAVVTSGTSEPTFGYRLDGLYGSDYRWTLMRGLLNNQLLNSQGNQNLYGFDPIEFYVNAYVPNLFQGTEFRAGRMYNPWGYESLEAVGTPFRSRSYTFNNTPFTIMGVGAFMTFSSQWSAAVVLANGDDVFVGPAEEGRVFAYIKWSGPANQDTVTLGTTLGRGKFNTGQPFAPATVSLAFEPAGQNNFNSFDLVWSHTFTRQWSYVLETQYSYQTCVPANVPGGIIRPGVLSGTAHWVSAVHYLICEVTSRFRFVFRYETFDDVDGQRTGFVGVDNNFTVGGNWYWNKSIIVRPEIRYDVNTNGQVYEGHPDLLTASIGMIVRW